jgi:hypothetical protein
MKTSKKINRLGYLLTAVGLFVAVLLPSMNAHKASAAQINARYWNYSSIHRIFILHNPNTRYNLYRTYRYGC